jgi:hypothetical protein
MALPQTILRDKHRYTNPLAYINALTIAQNAPANADRRLPHWQFAAEIAEAEARFRAFRSATFAEKRRGKQPSAPSGGGGTTCHACERPT